MGRGMRLHRGGAVGADQGLTSGPAPEPASGPASGPTRLFYDGGCGFCHAAVRFVARRDAAGRIRFAPLGGVTFQRQVPEVDRRDLPDSLVVLAPGSRPLTRSDAVAHLLRALGGAWAVGARLLAIVPRPLRDGAYDLVARFRARLFRRPEGVCPCLPPALLDRFDP